jgi:DNA-binding Lrp family transcriptional regulator
MDGAAAEDGPIVRTVNRISWTYVLRAFQLLIELFGDIRGGLVAQAVNAANTAHVDARTREGRAAAGPRVVLPDEHRRPISVARLADSLGLPFESTRRIVQRLIDKGACRRVSGGVIVPASMVERAEALRAVRTNLGYVRRFLHDLQEVGLAEPFVLGSQTATEESDAVLARVVGRPSVDYLLRALQLLVDAYGDIRVGMVMQTIVVANTAHLSARSWQGPRHGAIDDPAPDDLRRPISIARIGESLGLSYETIRGQAQRLIEAGLCHRVDAGLIAPQEVMERPDITRAMIANVGYVRKFVRDLHALRIA